MKTNLETITVECFGGKQSKRFQYETDEYKGQTLGNSIRGDEPMCWVSVDHIDTATEEALVCNGKPLPKGMIAMLEYSSHVEHGPFQVSAVAIPVWLADKLGM